MTRVPRRLAGIGAADLATTAAFDAYVGPAREVTVDPVRGFLKLHDGSTPGGIFPSGPVPVVTSFAAIQALDTTQQKFVTLNIPGNPRSGTFAWATGDFSAKIAADTVNGIYIKATAIAATVGSWVRVFSGPWRSGWFNIIPFNSATPNTAGFNAMMALAAMQDTCIEWPAGIHQFNAKITVSTAFSLVLFSSAIKECELQWTTANGGIDLTFTDPLQPPTIRGFNFTTTIAGGGTALKITGVTLASATEAGPLVEDIDCRGKTVASTYWTQGIYFKLCWYPRCIRPDIKGLDDATSPFDMTDGLYFEDCQAPFIRDVTIFHCERGITGAGSTHGEGLNVSGGEIVGVSYGIDWNLGAVKPCIAISDLHINAYVRDIRLVNVYQIAIHDLLLYKTHVSTSTWEGIECTNCAQVDIHNNRFSTAGLIDTTPGISTPIALINSFDCTISNCEAFGWVTPNSSFVVLANAATANNVIDGLTIANDGSPTNMPQFIGIVSSPGVNTIRNCVPNRNINMTSGDTTPDVSNMSSDLLVYAGAAVTVTTFDNPNSGQEFTLFSNTGTAVVTLSNNASGTGLILKSGTNYLMPAGSFIRFKYTAGFWREMWRS